MTHTDRTSAIPFALLLLLLLALSGCEKCAPQKKAPEEAKPATIKSEEINLKETRFAAVPEDYEVRQAVFSADGSKAAYVARDKEGKQFVVMGDEPGPPYDDIWVYVGVLSPDGQRSAYSGKKEGKWYFVLDGKEAGGPYEDTGITLFSPDGRFVVCDVKNDGKWSLLAYDGAKEVYRSPAFSGSSVRQPLFSPDGRLLVFEYFDINDKEWTLFILDLPAGKIIKERHDANDAQERRLFFSSDSSRFLYATQNEGRHVLVLVDIASNEERSIELPYTEAAMFALSPDGKKVAYMVTREGKHFLVESLWESPAKGKERGPHDVIGPMAFDPGSTTVAYLAMQEGKWRAIGGDMEGPEYHGVGNVPPAFSPDGSKIAYPAMKGGRMGRRGMEGGKWFMVVSPASNPAVAVEGPAYDMAVTPVWSPDGKYIAYRARTGTMEAAKRFMVIADTETGKVIKEGPVQDEVWPPVWSADGKAAAYGTRQGRELWWRVEAAE